MESDSPFQAFTFKECSFIYDWKNVIKFMCGNNLLLRKNEKVTIKFGELRENAYLRRQKLKQVDMSNWYDKYLSIYGKPFSEVPQDVIDGTRERLAALQSDNPIASIVVIGYNEETHLQACLLAISEIKCKYPVEIIGVYNDSKDRTAEIY